ncbi:GNAT family N-acetyltransferase [Jannaschia seohaensis]|uniref:Phosphinothricin acetyltransferase n=1 Tax=Jannaschia seohaensis TaxID=475081 RepID=A0A2Y9BZJ2_9RHOB|nr:GNAT family N-acetyltransferase [Jannaschia seohaensis]PWJ20387.1 phosphinothricin acetyltransferase [Jannaschia seohaensis]SSA44452.1 phosphinothricin acetyltransferase [Jannaschia seohaensis]
MILRAPRPADGPEITAIHAEGLATGHASFRDRPMGWEEFEAGFALALLAEIDGAVAGFAGVAPTSSRAVYSGVGEVSVYVAARSLGRGVGRALLSRLVAESEAAGWWTLVAQIFPQNPASLALHRACGFEALGTRRGLGRMSYGPMAGRWRDVVMLERRSAVVGAAG